MKEMAETSLDYAKTPQKYNLNEYVKAFQKLNTLFQDQKTKYAENLTTFTDLFGSKDAKAEKKEYVAVWVHVKL